MNPGTPLGSMGYYRRSLRDEAQAVTEGGATCRLSLGASATGEGVTEVPLFLQGGASIGGVQVELRFDPGAAEVAGVRAGPLVASGGWQVETHQRLPGRLTVLVHSGMQVEAIETGSPGVLAWIQLRPGRAAATTAALELLPNSRAVTPGGEPLDLTPELQTPLAAARISLERGWHLFAPPLRSATGDLVDLLPPSLRPLLAYGWDGTRYQPNPIAEPGEAHWLFIPSDREVTVVGLPTAGGQIHLRKGWNLVGLPRPDNPVPWRACTLDAGRAMPAVDAPDHLAPVLWRWNADRAQYAVDWLDTAELTPWQGNWLLALQPCALTIPQSPDSPLSPASHSPTAPSWSLPLTLTTDAARDTAWAQVSETATAAFDGFRQEIPKPPPAPGGVSLHFVHPEWRSRTAGATDWFATDTRGPVGATPTVWHVEALSERAETAARLAWPDLSTLPNDLSLTLADLETGESRYLRTSSGLSFRLVPEHPRRFVLTAERRINARLTFGHVAAAPARSGGFAIAYSLNKPARVQARVVAPTGRVAAEIESGRAATSGLNTLTWTGRARDGRLVPRGLYLIQLIARTEDGQAARRICTVSVR